MANGARYLPDYDWRWLKAQGYQESLLDAGAKSRAGAMGVMQLMPATWAEETEQLGIIASPYSAKANILVGARYMKKMLRIWKAPRSDHERLELAQASYNAGAGSIIRAQAKCGDARTWQGISPCLHQVTGRHSAETITYVRRIKRWFQRLL